MVITVRVLIEVSVHSLQRWSSNIAVRGLFFESKKDTAVSHGLQQPQEDEKGYRSKEVFQKIYDSIFVYSSLV